MRRVLVPFLMLVIILSVPNTGQVDFAQIGDAISNQISANDSVLSHAGSSGNTSSTILYMSRIISGLNFGIYNSYIDLNHNGLLDLTGYHVPGWSLYKAVIDATSIDAAAERVSLNVNPTTYIRIRNDTGVTDLTTDVLYQEFYNQAYDGKLENYTIGYNVPYYDPTLGEGYLVVRSDFSDPLTNTTGWITPFFQAIPDQTTTHDCASDNAILNASTPYYVVIDGTGMVGDYSIPLDEWFFNKIYWRAQPVLGLETGGRIRDYPAWYTYGIGNEREAELNYTYTPWNKTSSSPMIFANAEAISLKGNLTALSATSWSFVSGTNLSLIEFESTQSVDINYSITLWYQKAGNATTAWNIQTPESNVEWNVTTSVTYPVLSGTIERFLNYSVQSDWMPSALYNGSSLIVGTHTKYSTIVQCTDMTDGTWTLSSLAPNYVGNIDLTGVIDGKVSILTDMDIDATIEDGDFTPMNGGTTNLTVLQGGSSIYAPPEIAASSGSASFVWDIDSTTLGNGTHSIEIWWTNGLEAGYNATEVFVYYPTTLLADDSIVNAYAEDSFAIGIDFDQDFPVRGLDGSLATVEYSFDGGANTILIDQTGGRWTATVSTAGKTNGTYFLYVYAEGYGLENQSLIITVNLVYETLALNWSWSNGNNIAYLERTNLSVTYQFVNGTRIQGATVNITYQSQTYPLSWDSTSGNYWIELHGVNFTGVPDNFTLILNAWKAGHEAQYNDTAWIYIQSATGEFFLAEYSPSLAILYIESLTISVTYNYSSSPILGANVTVTINGTDLRYLVFNPISEKWEISLDGTDITVGTWQLNVTARMDGFATRYDDPIFIVQADTPILSSSWIGDIATTDYETEESLSITLTDSIGTPINDATVSFTAFSTLYSLASGTAGVYTFSIVPNATRGVESIAVTVVRSGYVTSQITVNLTVEATTSLILSHSIAEWEEWNITIEAEYMDTYYNTPITDASVNITLGGTLYILQYVDDVYAVTITLNIAPGEYTINAVGSAQYAAYAADQSSLTVNDKEVLHIILTFAPPRVVAGQFMEVRATLMSNRTENVVSGELIYFEILITFANGTVIHYTDASMVDTTNNEGVATYGFDVPEGQIESLTATAWFVGSRIRWSAETTRTTGVEVSILALVFAFLTSRIGIMIIFSLALLGIVATGYNRGIKPKKRAARLSLENQLQMFKDLETVQHFMAIYLDRGTCVFYHPFTEERIQPDLISGFIAAITSVYGEIKGDGVRGTLEEIQYHGLRLNSYSGQYIIGILILEGEMTPLLRERLQFFVELFENQYDQDLDGWTGLVDCFDPEWVVSTLNASFNYAWHLAHRFGPTQKVKKTDARILDYISAVRDERNEFYLSDLLTPLAEMLEKTEPEVLDRLLHLQDRGIIIPIGVQTILQRQGLALVDGTEQPLFEPPSPEPVEELEFEELTEEVLEEPQVEKVEEPEPEPEVDSMEAFVQDVESLLVERAKEEKKEDSELKPEKIEDSELKPEKKEDSELEKFAKELRAKIGEDEESED
ncbi:MAG: carboxypeptidase-like regulatory domain-containing protein [Candidatus Sifarchaeia archaeon]